MEALPQCNCLIGEGFILLTSSLNPFNKNQEIFCQKGTYNKYEYHKGINTISKSKQNHAKSQT